MQTRLQQYTLKKGKHLQDFFPDTTAEREFTLAIISLSKLSTFREVDFSHR